MKLMQVIQGIENMHVCRVKQPTKELELINKANLADMGCYAFLMIQKLILFEIEKV
jgi:hypothetical protein